MSTEQDAQSGPLTGVKAAMRKAVQGAQAAVSSRGTSSTENSPEDSPGAPRTKVAPMSTSTTPSKASPVAAPPPAKKAPAKKAPAKKAPATIPPPGDDATPSADSPAPAPRPAQGPRLVPVGGPVPSGAPRRVRLAVSRVDPWSVMKLSFLLSVAVGIMIVVATFAAWTMIDSLGVFASVDQLLREVLGQEAAANLNLMQYFEFDRFLSAATLIAVVDVVLLTALATIGAFLYNITAALVGGLHLTLTDE